MASDNDFITILKTFNVAFELTKKGDGICARVPGEKGLKPVKLIFSSKVAEDAQKNLVELVRNRKKILDYLNPVEIQNGVPPVTSDKKTKSSSSSSRPSSTKQVDNNLVTRLDKENNDLKRKLTDIEKQIESLQSENRKITQRSQELEQDNKTLKAQPKAHPDSTSDLKKQIRDHEATINNLQGNLQKLTRENSNLKKAQEKENLDQGKDVPEHSETIKKHSERLEKLESQNSSLKTKVDDLTSQLEMAKVEIENAKQQSKKEPVARPPSKENSDIKRKSSEIDALKQENKAVLTELEDSRRKCNELEKVKQDLNERATGELKKMASAKEDIEKKLTDARLEVKKCEEKLKRCSKEIVTRVDLVDQIKAVLKGNMPQGDVFEALITKNAENIDRLAAEMNAKVAADESALENISIKCRPMNVAEDYNLLCSNAWLEAKNALDEDEVDEEKAARFLCKVLEVAEQEAGKAYKTFIDKLQNALDSQKPLPQNVITSVGDYLRATVANFKHEPLVLAVTKHLEQTAEYKGYTKHKDVQIFIKESAILAWKMVIQRPAMCFDTPGIGKPFKNEEIADLFWGSNPKNKGALLRYYVTPVLKHGDKPMAKGKVIVK